jgi:trimeric autotransporter adhesin
MKKIFKILAVVLITVSGFRSQQANAQAPAKMSYQAVVRDGSNALVATQSVGMQISILQGSTSGTSVYVETQTAATNTNGLVSIEIGNGTVVSGDFTTIDWSIGPYFIKTETDPTGGSNYTISGTSQLKSVPYALYAASSDSSTPQTISQDGNTITLSDGGGSVTVIDTDTQLDAAGVAALGFTSGVHTVDTDTQLDAAGVTALGFTSGAHTVDTDTQLDAAGVTALGFTSGAHTVDTDTQLDAAGVTALGFTSGAHTVDTDTQLDEIAVDAYVANNGYLTTVAVMADADNNTKIQVEETANEDIIRFDLGGVEKLRLNGSTLEFVNSGESVFIGEGAGVSDDLSSNRNVGIGHQALYANTTGNYNTANGYRALYANTTGTYNVANGYRVLYSNTTGSYNTANGNQGLYLNTTGASNTANGYRALIANTTGNYNMANGAKALYSNTTGNYNMANGPEALYANITGSGNTANGYQALYANTTGASNTANGYRALYANTTGNFNAASGNYTLNQNTTGYSNTALGYSTGSSVTTGVNLTLLGYNAEPSTVSAINEITLGNNNIAALRCNVQSITSLSDERDKKNIRDLSQGLGFIMQLRPRQFNWDKREWYTNGQSDLSKMKATPTAGFIAQELDKVQTDAQAAWLNLVLKNNPDKWEATYGNLLPVLVKAIQDQQEIIAELNRQQAIQEVANTSLENRLAKLEKTLGAQALNK